MRPIARGALAIAGSLLLGLGALGAGQGLPSSPYAARIDGDPREAFLLGALELREFDAISGNADGRARAYALATREGLYVALLSTEPPGAHLLVVSPPEGPGAAVEPQPPPAAKPPGGIKREFLGPPVRTGGSSAPAVSKAGEAPSKESSPDAGHPEFLGPPVRADEPPGSGLVPQVGVGTSWTGTPPQGPKHSRAASWRTTPDAALAGDWMAVRVKGAVSALFVLTPNGATVSVGEDGRPSPVSDLQWVAAGSRFGHTWAGEWLLPWKTLGLSPGAAFHLSVLRGRKLLAQGTALEVLSTSSSERSPSRWGGEGLRVAAPAAWPQAAAMPRALKPYEVRSFVPPEEALQACADAAPAGEIVTAWLELPPSGLPWRVRVRGLAGGAEAFRVDYWWQAGTREEQDALLPARAASGAGDRLVAERLFPQPAQGFGPSLWPTRVYLRGRLPKDAPPGTIESAIEVLEGQRLVASLPWRVLVAPPLPPSKRMCGIYYFEADPSRWAADLADLARHGLTAVTCPASDPDGAGRFIDRARAYGLEGGYLLKPSRTPPTGAWAYVTDEPSTEGAVGAARAEARRLQSLGYHTWGALAWPVSLGLARDLDAVAFAPNLLDLAGDAGLARGQWVYFQGLREDPLANRVAAGLLSFARGLSGFWVFCYASGGEGETDWTHPFLRHDALVENGPGGERIPTVEWEALREGILDGRLREALGPKVVTVDARFPQVAEVLSGRDWLLTPDRWDAAAYRTALVSVWGGGP